MASYLWPSSGGAGGGVATLNTLTGDITLAGGTGISLGTLGNTITITATGAELTFADSIVNTAGTITLIGDTATPGASKYYGTTSAGTGSLGYNTLSFTNITGQAALAQLPSIATQTVLANATGGTATPTAVSLGTVTEATSSVLTLSGWTDSTIGSPTIQVKQATTSQSGYLSNTDWNTFNGKQAAGSYITALTGDGSASGPGSAALTLATVNTNTGTFASVTVNGKGLVTSAAALSGDLTTSGAVTTLATVNTNTGSFGSSTAIPSLTVNGKGLITAASTNVVIAPAGTLSGTTLNSTVVTSSLTSVGTIATGVWNGSTVAVANGGTGDTSFTAYTPICGGTTTTGALQSVASVGSSGQVLTSNGAAALPTFQPVSAGTLTKSYVFASRSNAGGGPNHGSTNTTIRQMTIANETVGTDITYANSTTAGTTFTINTAGVYTATYCDRYSGGAFNIGISKNGSALTTGIDNITYGQGRRTCVAGAATQLVTCTVTLVCAVSDILYPQDDGNCNQDNLEVYMAVTKVSN